MNRFKLVWGGLLALAICWLPGTFYRLKPAIFAAGFLARGNTVFEKADFGDAEVFYRKAADNDPGNASEITYNLGNSLYRQGRFAEAGKAYGQSLKSAPGMQPAWYNLGNARFLSGDTAGSLEAFKQALLLDKTDKATRRNFLFVVQALKRAEKKKQPKPENASPEEETKRQEPDKEGREEKGKPGKEQPDQPAKLSEKAMEDLLSQISKNEEAVRGKINNAKQLNRKLPPGELDY